jgi:hypothetical protein
MEDKEKPIRWSQFDPVADAYLLDMPVVHLVDANLRSKQPVTGAGQSQAPLGHQVIRKTEVRNADGRRAVHMQLLRR